MNGMKTIHTLISAFYTWENHSTMENSLRSDNCRINVTISGSVNTRQACRNANTTSNSISHHSHQKNHGKSSSSSTFIANARKGNTRSTAHPLTQAVSNRARRLLCGIISITIKCETNAFDLYLFFAQIASSSELCVHMGCEFSSRLRRKMGKISILHHSHAAAVAFFVRGQMPLFSLLDCTQLTNMVRVNENSSGSSRMTLVSISSSRYLLDNYVRVLCDFVSPQIK